MNLEEISVMTPKKFAIKIETIVAKGVSYMDAILDYLLERDQMGMTQLHCSYQNPSKKK